jgi:hypothetical protein
MGRKRQRQKTAAPAKTAATLKTGKAGRLVKTPTPSPSASGDDGYSALENLSDSDEDEDSVEAADGEYLIHEALGEAIAHAHSPRPLDTEEDGDDEDDGYEEDEEDGVAGEVHDETDASQCSQSSWNGISTSPEAGDELGDEPSHFAAMQDGISSPQSQPGRKVVRFAVPPEASSDDETDSDEDAVDAMFPDIFYNLDALPQSIRRRYERERPQSPPPQELLASEAIAFLDAHGIEFSTGESEMDPDVFAGLYDTDTPLATPTVETPRNMMFSPGVSPLVSQPARLQPDQLDGYECESQVATGGAYAPLMVNAMLISDAQLMETPTERLRRRRSPLRCRRHQNRASRPRSWTSRRLMKRTRNLSSCARASRVWDALVWTRRSRSPSPFWTPEGIAS